MKQILKYLLLILIGIIIYLLVNIKDGFSVGIPPRGEQKCYGIGVGRPFYLGQTREEILETAAEGTPPEDERAAAAAEGHGVRPPETATALAAERHAIVDSLDDDGMLRPERWSTTAQLDSPDSPPYDPGTPDDAGPPDDAGGAGGEPEGDPGPPEGDPGTPDDAGGADQDVLEGIPPCPAEPEPEPEPVPERLPPRSECRRVRSILRGGGRTGSPPERVNIRDLDIILLRTPNPAGGAAGDAAGGAAGDAGGAAGPSGDAGVAANPEFIPMVHEDTGGTAGPSEDTGGAAGPSEDTGGTAGHLPNYRFIAREVIEPWNLNGLIMHRRVGSRLVEPREKLIDKRRKNSSIGTRSFREFVAELIRSQYICIDALSLYNLRAMEFLFNYIHRFFDRFNLTRFLPRDTLTRIYQYFLPDIRNLYDNFDQRYGHRTGFQILQQFGEPLTPNEANMQRFDVQVTNILRLIYHVNLGFNRMAVVDTVLQGDGDAATEIDIGQLFLMFNFTTGQAFVLFHIAPDGVTVNPQITIPGNIRLQDRLRAAVGTQPFTLNNIHREGQGGYGAAAVRFCAAQAGRFW